MDHALSKIIYAFIQWEINIAEISWHFVGTFSDMPTVRVIGNDILRQIYKYQCQFVAENPKDAKLRITVKTYKKSINASTADAQTT
jgi:hypothetical protein